MADEFEDLESWGSKEAKPAPRVNPLDNLDLELGKDRKTADVDSDGDDNIEEIEEESSNKPGKGRGVLLGLVAVVAAAGVVGLGLWVSNRDSVETAKGDDTETTAEEESDTASPIGKADLADLIATAEKQVGQGDQPWLAVQTSDHDVVAKGVVQTELERLGVMRLLTTIYGEDIDPESITVDSEVGQATWLKQEAIIAANSVFVTETILEGGYAVNNDIGYLTATIPSQSDQVLLTGAFQGMQENLKTDFKVLELDGPVISFNYADDVLNITGELPDEKIVNKMINSIKPIFPNVESKVKISPNRYAGLAYAQMGNNLAIVKPLSEFEIDVTNTEFNINLSDAIAFDSGSADLQPQVIEFLGNYAESPIFSRNPVSITGHTDNKGTDEQNLALSLERAQSVADVLVTEGVPDDAVTVDGKGESEPVADNATEQGRSLNRRVELTIKT